MFWKKKEKTTLSVNDNMSNVEGLLPFKDSFSLQELVDGGSIYGLIRKSVHDNEGLSDDFELEPDSISEEFSFAQGARDGMYFYHMNIKELDDEEKKSFISVFTLVNSGRYYDADAQLKKYFEKRRMIETIDFMQKYLIEHQSENDMDKLYKFAFWEMIASSHKECVKYGLSYMELLDLREDEDKQAIISVLSLCDEFTMFGAFCMQRWPHAETRMRVLGERVSGWGRIHIVRLIEATDAATKEWLLTDGVSNTVRYSYSAYDCYTKSELFSKLLDRLDDKEFQGATNIMNGLLDEGPCSGISLIEEKERYEFIHRYLGQFTDRDVSIEVYDTALDLLCYMDGIENRDEVIFEECRQILLSDRCTDTVKRSLKSGEGSRLASALNIDVRDDYFRLLEEDFDAHYSLAGALMKENEENVDRVVSIFEREYARILSENEEFHGYGSKEMSVVFCIQELKPYVGKGVSLLKAVMNSPAQPLRNMVCNVAESWMEKSGKSILEISPELQESFVEMLDKEKVEDIRLKIKGILCNKIYKKPPLVLNTDNT